MAERIHPAAMATRPHERIRAIGAHAPLLHEHLARLSEIDRCARLGRPVAAPAIEAYCTRLRGEESLIVACVVGDRVVASGELVESAEDRVFGGGNGVADLTIAVEEPHRRAGIAGRVCAELIRRAPQRRLALVRMAYAADNAAMARLAHRLGAIDREMAGRTTAEICTGWMNDALMPILFERSAGFRPLLTQ
ncbi:MAG: GNAT family N-acetyltransferase [Alphaproteobacteria bacterium]